MIQDTDSFCKVGSEPSKFERRCRNLETPPQFDVRYSVPAFAYEKNYKIIFSDDSGK